MIDKEVMADHIEDPESSTHTHRGQQLENPPKGYKDGFENLIWNLRAYGFPISLESISLVREYLESQDLEPEEADYEIVAQSIDQRYDLEMDLNNTYRTANQLTLFDYFGE